MRKGLLLSLCVAAVVCATAFSADAPAPGEVTIFEPEDDWKEIGENQHLPGVSVIGLQAGGRGGWWRRQG